MVSNPRRKYVYKQRRFPKKISHIPRSFIQNGIRLGNSFRIPPDSEREQISDSTLAESSSTPLGLVPEREQSFDPTPSERSFGPRDDGPSETTVSYDDPTSVWPLSEDSVLALYPSILRVDGTAQTSALSPTASESGLSMVGNASPTSFNGEVHNVYGPQDHASHVSNVHVQSTSNEEGHFNRQLDDFYESQGHPQVPPPGFIMRAAATYQSELTTYPTLPYNTYRSSDFGATPDTFEAVPQQSVVPQIEFRRNVDILPQSMTESTHNLSPAHAHFQFQYSTPPSMDSPSHQHSFYSRENCHFPLLSMPDLGTVIDSTRNPRQVVDIDPASAGDAGFARASSSQGSNIQSEAIAPFYSEENFDATPNIYTHDPNSVQHHQNIFTQTLAQERYTRFRFPHAELEPHLPDDTQSSNESREDAWL